MKKDYQSYALLMKALGDENRVQIFEMLSKGERCACEILDQLAITQSTLSYHMKLLCDSGLVNGRRDGIWMRYTINPDTMEILKEFFTGIEASFTGIDSDCCKGK